MDNTFERKLLEDTLEDMRTERKFLKKINAFLCGLSILLILCIVGISVYFSNQLKKQNAEFMDFMNEIDFSSEIKMENEDSFNLGGINVR